MTPHEIAAKAAEEVFNLIDRTKRINKAEIAEAIEKVLLTSQVTAGSGYGYGVATFLDRPPINTTAWKEPSPALLAVLLGFAECGND